jgi:hypothetical protein
MELDADQTVQVLTADAWLKHRRELEEQGGLHATTR